MKKSKLKKAIAFCLGKYMVNINALEEVCAIIEAYERKTFTAKQIRQKLLELNPQIKNRSEFTNPFLYSDIEEWYHELGKIK